MAVYTQRHAHALYSATVLQSPCDMQALARWSLPMAWLPELMQARCWTCRSWYIGLFQWPWLPELMMRSGDHGFVDAAFTSGAMACKRPGAVSPDHVAHFKHGLRQPYACSAAVNYYRAAVDSATRFPSLAGALLSRSDHHTMMQILSRIS